MCSTLMGNVVNMYSFTGVRPIAPPNDDLRLDIVLPGDRYIYVKAATREERQRWLVALGNARRDNPEHSGMFLSRTLVSEFVTVKHCHF